MLRILGSTYGSIGRLRAAMYERGWLSCERLDSPVVSIGGLSVGEVQAPVPGALWGNDIRARLGEGFCDAEVENLYCPTRGEHDVVGTDGG